MAVIALNISSIAASTQRNADQTTKGVLSVSYGNGLHIESGRLDIFNATESSFGTVRVDTSTGLKVSSGVISAKVAKNNTLGTVKPDGTTITIDTDGTIHGSQTVTRLSQLTNDAGYVTDTDLATSETNGICRPDNETTFVSDGVISAIDYASQIDDLLAMIASLRRRVAALESGSAVSDVTYEDGSLVTGWTYDNYAMITDSEYDNGSIA